MEIIDKGDFVFLRFYGKVIHDIKVNKANIGRIIEQLESVRPVSLLEVNKRLKSLNKPIDKKKIKK